MAVALRAALLVFALYVAFPSGDQLQVTPRQLPPPCLPSPVSPTACGLRWGTQAAAPHLHPRARFTTRAPLGLRRGSAALALLLGLLVGLRHLPPRARHQQSSNKASRGPFQKSFGNRPHSCYPVALASRSCPEAGQGNLAHKKQRPPRT